MPTSKLTPHFTLEEMVASQTAARLGINNLPTPEAYGELVKTCQLLEIIRDALAAPIIITSGYRSPELNKAVGGAAGSQHQTGQAADWICPGFGTPLDVCLFVAKMDDLPFDQLIHEYDQWVHISQSPTPRRQKLTINNYGTSTGIS